MTGGYSIKLQASITSQVISQNSRCNIALGFESGKAYACREGTARRRCVPVKPVQRNFFERLQQKKSLSFDGSKP
jgi:hypothetical protein